MGEGEMEDDRGMVMEVEGARNVGGMGMLSCMRRLLGCGFVYWCWW